VLGTTTEQHFAIPDTSKKGIMAGYSKQQNVTKVTRCYMKACDSTALLTGFAIEFITLANKFVPLEYEFIPLAIEFVT